MKTNFYKEIDQEVRFFVDKFKEIGWKQVDVSYLTKRLPFITNPSARNEEWQHSIGMVLYPELLTYIGARKGERGVDEIWICCRVGIDYDEEMEKDPWSSERLTQLTNYLKEEIKKINWKAFYDEDAFRYNFTRPEFKKNLEEVRIRFYLNKDYPEGVWENHTLD